MAHQPAPAAMSGQHISTSPTLSLSYTGSTPGRGSKTGHPSAAAVAMLSQHAGATWQQQAQRQARQLQRFCGSPAVRCSATKQRTAAPGKRERAAVPLPDPAAIELANAADADFTCNTVQWYPGHIAKAERQLKEQLKMVDLVLEVAKWIGSKPRVIIVNRKDMVSSADRAAWDKHYAAEAAQAAKDQAAARQRSAARAAARAAAAAEANGTGASHLQQQQEQEGAEQQDQEQEQQLELEPPSLPQQVFWTDGKTGAGIHGLRRASVKLSDYINAKRARRGLAPRPVRCCVIGFPNIGKSALINRLLGRKVVESAARPGVTRVLRWVRMGGDLDLLDAPGIIPASFNDQAAAQALAMCNDIGEASYVDSLIAAALLIRIKQLPRNSGALQKLAQRYGAHPLGLSAEDFVVHVAGQVFGGDREKAGVRLLNDYRNGVLGSFALELPPSSME